MLTLCCNFTFMSLTLYGLMLNFLILIKNVGHLLETWIKNGQIPNKPLKESLNTSLITSLKLNWSYTLVQYDNYQHYYHITAYYQRIFVSRIGNFTVLLYQADSLSFFILISMKNLAFLGGLLTNNYKKFPFLKKIGIIIIIYYSPLPK